MKKQGLIPIKKDEGPFYRYRMPMVQSRTISSGNGIRTAFLNAPEIAKALNRTLQLLNQWLSYSLGCMSSLGKKMEDLILNGNHQSKDLQELIFEFIEIFVLCPSCSNPETNIEPSPEGLKFVCSACGVSSLVNINRSPKALRTAEWLSNHISSQQKQTAKNLTTSTKAGKLDKIDKYAMKAIESPETEGIPINESELDPLAAKYEGKAEKTVSSDSKKGQLEFSEFQSTLMEMLHSDCECEKIYRAIEAKLPNVNSGSRLNLLIQMLFHGRDNDFLKIIEKRKELLIFLTLDDGSQKDFLTFLANHLYTHPALLTSAPVIFQTLFVNEVIEEGPYNEWYKHPSLRFEKDKVKSNELRGILSVFNEWLAKAQIEKEETAPQEDEEEKADDSQVDDLNDI